MGIKNRKDMEISEVTPDNRDLLPGSNITKNLGYLKFSSHVISFCKIKIDADSEIKR
jgi:hypothetical protein